MKQPLPFFAPNAVHPLFSVTKPQLLTSSLIDNIQTCCEAHAAYPNLHGASQSQQLCRPISAGSTRKRRPLLSNYPFEGDYPIIQQFGDSPRSFGSLKCQGVQVRGHPGIDFALPIGRPVLAVAGGTVLAARDEDGLGLVALVQHHWGQTLYAHLSALHVAPGDPADAGQTLGLSGDSGLGAQPHLHFGLRITPYTLADGWCGYTDPVPYLHRLTRGRGPLIGPHIIGGVHRRLDLLRHWQPRQIVVVDPNPDEMSSTPACPDSVIIGRVYEADHVIMQRIRTDPPAAARWAHEKTLSRVSPDVDYWQFANEILQDGDSLPLLNRFELERMRLAEAEHANRSYRCALFGFSVSNPDLPETAVGALAAALSGHATC